MPANIVKKGQEAEWEKAKELVKKQYPNIKEGSPRFYRITTFLFKKLVKDKPNKKPQSKLEKVLREE